MYTTKLATVLGGLLLSAAAGSASASIATPEFRAIAPITIQLARHGHDDVGCDDHGTNACMTGGRDDQLARRGRGRDDVGCDDHGTDVCATGGRDDQLARRGRGRDDVGCDDHGTNACLAGDRSRES